MSVVIIGGHDRMQFKYKQICKKFGCKCKVFIQCPADFKNKIGTPDCIIVFTKTVAHKMVLTAQTQAQKSGVLVKHCHSSSSTALNTALEEYFEALA